MTATNKQAAVRQILTRVADAIAAVEPLCSATAVEVAFDRSKLRPALEQLIEFSTPPRIFVFLHDHEDYLKAMADQAAADHDASSAPPPTAPGGTTPRRDELAIAAMPPSGRPSSSSRLTRCPWQECGDASTF